MMAFDWPQRVTIREVGLRDGLQSIARSLRTAQKMQSIQGAFNAGIREIEVGYFVPPKLQPQLGETVDYPDPRQVDKLLTKARKAAGDKLGCGYFHDARGLGMAKVMAAMQAGLPKTLRLQEMMA
ncbi:hypothetical protein [Limnohabitans sp. Rim8]|jgi:isopropylmalate/homocitrate/citramalate synthase|uniref:hypothetical protein n=1 Tax=Limnohabitans sp. Rim8 TaxID=1100718 RepID=UPI0026159912|nr:hypothetical protein [Limnohabitans sp. Rim8]